MKRILRVGCFERKYLKTKATQWNDQQELDSLITQKNKGEKKLQTKCVGRQIYILRVLKRHSKIQNHFFIYWFNEYLLSA